MPHCTTTTEEQSQLEQFQLEAPNEARTAKPKNSIGFTVLVGVAVLFIIGGIMAICYFGLGFGAEYFQSSSNKSGSPKEVRLGGLDLSGVKADSASDHNSNNTALKSAPPTSTEPPVLVSTVLTVETNTSAAAEAATTEASSWWDWFGFNQVWNSEPGVGNSTVVLPDRPSATNATEVAMNATEATTIIPPINTTQRASSREDRSAQWLRAIGAHKKNRSKYYRPLDMRYVGTPWLFLYHEVIRRNNGLYRQYAAKVPNAQEGKLLTVVFGQPGLIDKIKERYAQVVDRQAMRGLFQSKTRRWYFFDSKANKYYVLKHPGDPVSEAMAGLWMSYEAAGAFLKKGVKVFGRNNLQLLRANQAIDELVAREVRQLSAAGLMAVVGRLTSLVYAIGNPEALNPSYGFDTTMINYQDTRKYMINYNGLDAGSFTNAKLDEFYFCYRYLIGYVTPILELVITSGDSKIQSLGAGKGDFLAPLSNDILN